MKWVRGVNWNLEPCSAFERSFANEQDWVILVIPDSELLRGGYKSAEPQRLAALVQRVGRERGWSRPLLEPYQILFDDNDTEAWVRCYHPQLGQIRQDVHQLSALPRFDEAQVKKAETIVADTIQLDLFDAFGPNSVP